MQRSLVSCMDFSSDENSLHIGTLGGFVLNYDFRLNFVTESFRFSENTPILGLSSYTPMKSKEFDLYSLNNNDSKNYLLLNTGNNDHELGLWNLDTLNCDILFKVNPLQGNVLNPFLTEIPTLIKEIINKDDNENDNLEAMFKNLSKYSYGNKMFVGKGINAEFYPHSHKRLSKLSNIYESSHTVQVSLSPLNLKFGENLFSCLTNENVPYILSAGNDNVIRYWLVEKEQMGKKSYIISAPNKLDNCSFSSSSFDNTIILQSNEFINTKSMKKEVSRYSEYLNYNGISFHLGIQNEFDPSMEILKYCTKISEAAHQNVITDLLTMNISNTNSTVLLSSSWDGTIKLWK